MVPRQPFASENEQGKQQLAAAENKNGYFWGLHDMSFASNAMLYALCAICFSLSEETALLCFPESMP
jgi:hypothetical protein